MFFDLTKEIRLDRKDYLQYRRLRILLYISCFSLLSYLAYLILFPTEEFNFSFISTNKGSVLNPRNDQGEILSAGKITAGEKIYFDSSLVGAYSKAEITLSLGENSPTPENEQIFLRNSHEAFLYPEGEPIGFKNGSQLKNKNNFYLVSDGKLRKFQSKTVLSELGFPEAAFTEVTEQELAQNSPNEEIFDTKTYPPNSLFKIDGDYYALNTNGALEKFISPRAFDSQYTKEQVIPKDTDFFEKFPLAENQIGFSDGSLVSFGDSVFIASEKKLYPIGDPIIFINQGFEWSDIITIDGDEFSFYEKERMFNLSSAHPDGTIFLTTDSAEWFLIKGSQKHKLLSEKIAQTWLKKKPISVKNQSSGILANCRLRNEFWRDLFCEINLSQAINFRGIYYEFSLSPQSSFQIDNLNVRYEKNATWENFKLSLKNMFSKIRFRYGI